MAYTLSCSSKFLFSIFKKKVEPLMQQNYLSLSQLYNSLNMFERSLDHLQLKKMPKLLEGFNKRMRRLYRQESDKLLQVPMSLSHTYINYTKLVDEMMFGNLQIEVEITIDQIQALTTSMVTHDLDIYLRQVIPKVETHFELYERIKERFINIEERLSRELYKGYFTFSNTVSKVAFLQEREYKGDFKFQLIDDIPKLQKLTECLYNCAKFNKLRNKLALAAELLISTKLSQLSNKSVGKLLFCLANSGRSLKFIQNNFQTIKERLKYSQSFELLFYMIVSGLEDAVWFGELSNFTIFPKDTHEQFIANWIKTILNAKFGVNIQVKQQQQYCLKSQKHEGEQFFQDFLMRYSYEYIMKQNPVLKKRIYEIQGKNFICLDNWLTKDEDYVPNGLGLVMRQFLMDKNENIKQINWPRMQTLDKRGPKDQYIFSKFKGIEKPKKTKVRFYQ